MKLKRTTQCDKCPWRVAVDPRDIPNGYCPTKHAALDKTIAKDGDLSCEKLALLAGLRRFLARLEKSPK